VTVGELRKRLQGLAGDMPVEMEIVCDHFDPEDDVAMSDLLVASVETRCDEVERFYLFGKHGKVQAPPEEPRGRFVLVPGEK
jgi:hypothetical protein